MVKIIKMQNGDELLAKETSPGKFAKVRAFHLNQNGHGGLIPWMMLSPDAEVEINGVASIVDAPLEIEKTYIQSTTELILG